MVPFEYSGLARPSRRDPASTLGYRDNVRNEAMSPPFHDRVFRSGTTLRAPDATTHLTLFVVVVFLVPGGFVVGFLGAAGRPSMLLGVLAFGWWILDRFAPEGRIAEGRQPVRLCSLLLLGAILVSYVAASIRPIDALEMRGADRGITLILGLLGLTLLAADCIRSRRRLDILLQRLSTGASVVATFGILQFFTGFDLARLLRFPLLVPHVEGGFQAIQDRSDLNRVAATAAHPIEFGVVMGLVFPIALHFALHPQGRRTFAWLRVALIAVAVPLAVSRSGTLALGIAFLVMWLSWPLRLKIHSAMVAMLGSLIMRSFVPGLLGTIKSLFTNIMHDPSTQGRTEDYENIGPYVSSPPITGRGFATFIPDRYFVLDNQYLGLYVETGLLGTLAMITFFLAGFGSARRARTNADPPTRSLGQALAASSLVMLVVAVTFDMLAFSMVSGIAFLLVGCSGALWRLTLPDRRGLELSTVSAQGDSLARESSSLRPVR
jgi:polysaccharide biosynthesis protein PslJ